MKNSLKTSTQLFLASLFAMLLVFLILGISIYYALSAYILSNTVKYVDATVEQIVYRLNTSLENIDYNVQRITENSQVQKALYNASYKTTTNDKLTLLRSEIYKTLVFSNNIAQIDFYSEQKQIYPYTKKSVAIAIPHDVLEKAKQENGSLVWLEDNESNTRSVIAIKRILLSEFGYQKGGYVVIKLKDDFFDFVNKDFQKLEGLMVGLYSGDNSLLMSYPSNTLQSLTIDDIEKNYSIVKSSSDYNSWQLKIFVPKKIGADSIRWLTNILLITFILAAVIFALFCRIIAYSITKPINDLKSFFKHSNGELKTFDKLFHNPDFNALSSQYNKLVRKNNELVYELIQRDVLKTKAEIKALQSQINPHFIVNALESVYLTILPKVDSNSSKVVLSLARLFQYILKAPDEVSVVSEIGHINQYLLIEKYRFGDKIQCTISIAPEAEGILIPKLLIQPLVENVIKHSVELSSLSVIISIKILLEKNYLKVIVSDNGIGISKERLSEVLHHLETGTELENANHSIGLSNIYRRLKSNYGDSALFNIHSAKENTGFVVCIGIPIKSVQ